MPIDNSSRFPKPLAADLLELSEGMAIVIDGDTAPKAITAGQYLFIKNHSTLATGGYHATAAIASGADITSSNVAADADGIVNGAVSKLNGNLATKAAKSDAIKNITRSGTTFTATKADGTTFTFTQQDTNTWRGIQNNLTSTSTTDSLSAAQGKALNDGLTGVKTITTGTTTGIRYFRALNSKLVIVNVAGETINTGANAWKTIGTLPSGYRPSYSFYFTIVDDLHSVPYEGRCNTNGVVEFYGSTAYATAIPTGTFSFLIP